MKVFRVIAFVLPYFICFGTNAQTVNGKKFTIEPYIQNVCDTSFNLLWETAEPGRDIVLIAEAEFNVLSPSFNRKVKDDRNNLFHNIKINGLKPGGKYFYKTITVLQSGDSVCSTIVPVVIPDYSRMPVSFAVIGDTQNQPLIWGKLCRYIYRERPSFLIHTGDMVQYGPNKTDWVDEFFAPAAFLFRLCPVYPALGNHEMNHDWFYRYFELPAPEWFYTIIKGNVLFVFANTNKDILPGSAQYKKLERILAASREDWKIVIHHQPVYTSDEYAYGNTWFQLGVHGDPNEMHLKRLYETYGVDVVFNGHVHSYERTWPIYKDRVDRINGVTYVTTGGGGGKPDKAAANKTWYAAKTSSSHHFVSVSINENILYAQTIDTLGILFDTWTIDKTQKNKQPDPPLITSEKQYFIDSSRVKVENLNYPQGTLRIGIHDEFISSVSAQMIIPIKESQEISAVIIDHGMESIPATMKCDKLPLFKALKKADPRVKANYYEGFWTALPEFAKEKPVRSFVSDTVSLSYIQPRVQDHFAANFTGSINIPETDIYRFTLESYDGSRLIIDDKEVIDNDGMHYEIRKEVYLALEKGIHSFEIQYFDFTRRETLIVLIGKQNSEMRNINNYIRRK